MKLNEYQKQAKTFAFYANPEYAFDNLFAEAGEVAGKIAKVKRGDKDGHGLINNPSEDPIGYLAEHDPEPILKELGDVLWQLSACCNELGVTLEDIAVGNLEKLQSRADRDKLSGEGDDR